MREALLLVCWGLGCGMCFSIGEWLVTFVHKTASTAYINTKLRESHPINFSLSPTFNIRDLP